MIDVRSKMMPVLPSLSTVRYCLLAAVVNHRPKGIVYERSVINSMAHQFLLCRVDVNSRLIFAVVDVCPNL